MGTVRWVGLEDFRGLFYSSDPYSDSTYRYQRKENVHFCSEGASGFENSLLSEHHPHRAHRPAGTRAAEGAPRAVTSRYSPLRNILYPSGGWICTVLSLITSMQHSWSGRPSGRTLQYTCGRTGLSPGTARPGPARRPPPRGAALTPTGSFGPGGDGFFSAGLRGILALLGEGTSREGRPRTPRGTGTNRTEMAGRGTGMDLHPLHGAETATTYKTRTPRCLARRPRARFVQIQPISAHARVVSPRSVTSGSATAHPRPGA